MFASDLTNKLENYVSKCGDIRASKINAFSFNWKENVYLFPPIHLIEKTVRKFLDDKVLYGFIITPAWSGLSSLHYLIELSIMDPIILPSSSVSG
mgnify:CR=1 FL=1